MEEKIVSVDHDCSGAMHITTISEDNKLHVYKNCSFIDWARMEFGDEVEVSEIILPGR